jgi:hypothetical protein
MAVRGRRSWLLPAARSNVMQSKFAVARTVGLAITIFGAGLVVLSISNAIRMNAELREIRHNRAVDIPVDLSKPGETAVLLVPKCSPMGGVGWDSTLFYLEVDPPLQPGESIEKLLQGLSASLTISDENKNAVIKIQIKPEDVHDFLIWGNGYFAQRFVDYSKGKYSAEVRVTSGAKNLAGRRQTIYLRHFSWDYEGLGVFSVIVVPFAIVCGMVTIIAALFSVPGLLRHGFRRPICEQVATRSDE